MVFELSHDRPWPCVNVFGFLTRNLKGILNRFQRKPFQIFTYIPLHLHLETAYLINPCTEQNILFVFIHKVSMPYIFLNPTVILSQIQYQCGPLKTIKASLALIWTVFAGRKTIFNFRAKLEFPKSNQICEWKQECGYTFWSIQASNITLHDSVMINFLCEPKKSVREQIWSLEYFNNKKKNWSQSPMFFPTLPGSDLKILSIPFDLKFVFIVKPLLFLWVQEYSWNL